MTFKHSQTRSRTVLESFPTEQNSGAEIDAQTQVIEAKGEAEAILLQGQALRENPSVLDLDIVTRWDGVMPVVVGPGVEGADVILPLGSLNTETGMGGVE